MSLFAFLDTMHHVIEHWEFAQHSTQHAHSAGEGEAELSDKTKVEASSGHDDEGHQNEVRLYISIFAILRLVVYSVWMYQERSYNDLYDYLKTNWFEMVKPS